MATPPHEERYIAAAFLSHSTPRLDGNISQSFKSGVEAPADIATGETQVPATREWSQSTSVGMPSPGDVGVAETPLPERTSRLSSVLNIFRRSSSSSRYRSSSQVEIARHQETRVIQRFTETREAVQGQIAELEKMKAELAALDAELERRNRTIESLEGTREHSQKLLERNSQLEILLASVQDELDSMSQKERDARHKAAMEAASARSQVDSSKQRVKELEHQLENVHMNVILPEQFDQLRRNMTEKEAELARIRAQLSGSVSEVEELRRGIDRERTAVERLFRERQTHMTNIQGVSVELKGLLEQNNALEEQLRSSHERYEVSSEELREKLKKANIDGHEKTQQVARLEAELQVSEESRKRAEVGLEEVRNQNRKLQQHLVDLDKYKSENERLKINLCEAEEQSRLESQHLVDANKRLKDKVASLQGIHERAQELLGRNGELESLLSDYTNKLSAAIGDDSPSVRRLRADHESVLNQLRTAEQRLHTQQNNMVVLEGTLSDTKTRLQAAESQLLRPSADNAVSTAAYQAAAQRAIEASSDTAGRQIASLHKEYDVLIKSLREGHARELAAKEAMIRDTVDSALLAKEEQHNSILMRKEAEWDEARLALERALDLAEKQKSHLNATIDRLKEASRAQDEEVRVRIQSVRDEAQRDALERIGELNRSLEGLVSHATSQLQREVDQLKQALAQALLDRDSAIQKQVELQHSVNHLTAVVDTKDASIAEMKRQRHEYEVTTQLQLDQLRAMINARDTRLERTNDEPALLSRVHELENLVANISEEFHAKLQAQMIENANTRRQKLEVEARVNNLISELHHLETRAATPNTMTEAERDELDQKIVQLSSELARAKSECKALTDELANEKKRFEILQKRPIRNLDTSVHDLQKSLSERLNTLIAEARNANSVADFSRADLESARVSAEQTRMTAEIEHLSKSLRDREARIDILQQTLREQRSHNPDTNLDQLRRQLQTLEGEKRIWREEKEVLQENLTKQQESLRSEMVRRDHLLQDLPGIQEELEKTRERLNQLERQDRAQFERLRNTWKTTTSGYEIVDTTILQNLRTFEQEIETLTSRAADYDAECRRLTDALEHRDAENRSLRTDITEMHLHIESNFARQREEQETRNKNLEREKQWLKEENDRLKENIEELRKNLAQVKSSEAQKLDHLLAQFNQKNMLFQEVEQEREIEFGGMRARLEQSMAAQMRLRTQVEKVTTELANKEKDVKDLKEAVQSLVEENGISHESLSSEITSNDWTKMIGQIESVVERLSRAEKESRTMRAELAALLAEQQRTIAASERIRAELGVKVAKSPTDAPYGRTVVRSSLSLRGGPLSGLNTTVSDIENDFNIVHQAHVDLMKEAEDPNRLTRTHSRQSSLTANHSMLSTTVGGLSSSISTSNKRRIETDDVHTSSKRPKMNSEE